MEAATAVLGQQVPRAKDAPGIREQTERMQGIVDRLSSAVSTLDERLAPLLQPVDRTGERLVAAHPEGLSDHALAMCHSNSELEVLIDRIQELAARVDH